MGEVPNGRIPMFLFEASRMSGAPDMVFKLVQPKETELNKRLPPDGITPSALVAAAAGSSNPDVAKAMLADKESNASAGGHIWAVRVADEIGTHAELRSRAQDALGDWLKQHG